MRAIDDTHHWKYTFMFRREHLMDRAQATQARAETTPDYHLVRNRSNRYLQDRDEMKNSTFLGMGAAFQVHDTWATEGAGPIQDRTQEHLTPADSGIAISRQMVMKAIDDVREGLDPFGVIRDPAQNVFPYFFAWSGPVPPGTNWKDHLADLERSRFKELQPAR